MWPALCFAYGKNNAFDSNAKQDTAVVTGELPRWMGQYTAAALVVLFTTNMTFFILFFFLQWPHFWKKSPGPQSDGNPKFNILSF